MSLNLQGEIEEPRHTTNRDDEFSGTVINDGGEGEIANATPVNQSSQGVFVHLCGLVDLILLQARNSKGLIQALSGLRTQSGRHHLDGVQASARRNTRAGTRPRQQRRPGPQGAQEEDAARGHFPRNEASRPLRKAVREEGPSEGGSGSPRAASSRARSCSAKACCR